MNRKTGVQVITFITIFLFIFTALSYTVQSIPPVTQETLIVDINGNGDYTSIQDAISNATTTDIIRIKEGIYRENNLEISKKLTIVGDNSSNTIIDFGGEEGFVLSSTYVEISNLQLTNAGEYAIYVSPDSDSCTISNCIINKDTAGVGILIRASSVVVSDCDIKGYSLTAIGIQLREYDNIIKYCNIQGLDVGVLALLNAHDNKIQNCNLFNNDDALDIRLNSKNNLVSNCNIYGNKRGIYIWQNSNDNSIYLNNFWRNDIDAADECNNTWDNGAHGNYWDDYAGTDANGDGIGDTSYTITQENKDDFPLMSIIFPDIISVPTNVELVTTSWDDTPSLTWNPSVYSKGIEGYYVKIDSNPEIYVGDTTSWTSHDAVSDGVHTFYVRAKGTDNTTSAYASITFSIDTMFIDTDEDGWSDEEEQEYNTDPNDPDNYPLDTDSDRIPDSADTDDDNDGYSDDMELSYGTDAKDSNDYPTDTDGDGVPDNVSPDGKYAGDVDDDDDGLTDAIEASLGSNPRDESDVKKIYIGGKSYYLIDVTQDGVYGILYEPTGDTTTAVEKYNENYLIDENGDGTWDYIYNTADGSISTYEEELTLPLAVWILLILAVLLTALFVSFYYLRRRYIKYRIPRKPERVIERPLIEKPLRFIAGKKKDTVEMISQTKTLLQRIQQDVEAYMEKLGEIEDQFMIPIEEEEEMEERPEEKPSELEDIHDIESKVDKLLSALDDDKDKN